MSGDDAAMAILLALLATALAWAWLDRGGGR